MYKQVLAKLQLKTSSISTDLFNAKNETDDCVTAPSITGQIISFVRGGTVLQVYLAGLLQIFITLFQES